MQDDQPISCSLADHFAFQTKYRKLARIANLFLHVAKQI